jgi:hypothetical protein
LEDLEMAKYEEKASLLSTEDFIARQIFIKASSFLAENAAIKAQKEDTTTKGLAGWKKLADQADKNLANIEALLPDIEYLRGNGFFN